MFGGTSGELQVPDEISHPFHARTGVPMLLNTSFNDSEPIVCTPEDAVNTFLSTGIDVLVMREVLVRRIGFEDSASAADAISARPSRRGRDHMTTHISAPVLPAYDLSPEY